MSVHPIAWPDNLHNARSLGRYSECMTRGSRWGRLKMSAFVGALDEHRLPLRSPRNCVAVAQVCSKPGNDRPGTEFETRN